MQFSVLLNKPAAQSRAIMFSSKKWGLFVFNLEARHFLRHFCWLCLLRWELIELYFKHVGEGIATVLLIGFTLNICCVNQENAPARGLVWSACFSCISSQNKQISSLGESCVLVRCWTSSSCFCYQYLRPTSGIRYTPPLVLNLYLFPLTGGATFVLHEFLFWSL